MREQQFRDIVTQAADGLLVIGANDAILFVNPASAVLLGRTEAELIGASLGRPVIADESTEIGILRKSGEIVTVEMRAAAITWDGAPAVLASLRDISAQVQAKTRIEHLNSVHRVIRNVNQLIASEKNPGALIQQACELLTGNRDYNTTWIAVGSGAGPTNLFAQAGFGDEFDRFAALLRNGEWPRCKDVALATDDRLVIAAPASYCEGCPLSTSSVDSSSCVVTTLCHGDDVLGLLSVSLAPPMSNDDEERNLLKEVAGDIAFALHNIEIERLRGESEERFKTITESSADAIFVVSREGRYVYANRASTQLLGYSTEELLQMTIADLSTPEQLAENSKRFEELLTSGRNFFELDLVKKNGSAVPVDLNGVVLANGLVHASCRDISERRLSEEALRRSEKEHRRAQRVAHIGHWSLSSPDGVPSWSDEVFRIFGIEPGKGEPSFTCHDTIIHPEEWPLLDKAVRRGFDSGEPFDLVFRILRPSQETGWMRAIGAPSLDGNGKVVKMFGTAQDVTDQKRAEKKLQDSEAYLASIIASIADPVFVKDAHFRFTLVNEALCKLMGKTRDELIGTTGGQCYPADELEEFVAMDREVLSSGKEMIGELPFTGSEGATRVLVTKKARYVDHKGDKFVVGVIRDITDIKQLQAQIAQSDRLASMGMLAAGVAHEINNPLSFILLNLESLTEDFPELLSAVRQGQTRTGASAETSTTGGSSEEANPLINLAMLDDMLSRFRDALGGARRIRDVVRGLGAFSRVEQDQCVPVNLNHAIDLAVNLASNETKYRARVLKDYERVPTVFASEGRLSQVFLNLIINAAHSMDEGDFENNEIRVRTWLEGEAVCAQVRDTGSGIDPKNLSKLFDPFFTTKQIGVGSGLGLAISKSIIEGYHGTISVHSELGEGTSFTIRLPVRAGAVQSIAAVAAPSEAPKVQGRILIVDDDAPVRFALARTLSGHETVQAGGGAEAKKILENDQAFDLILCDMMMPGISGIDLHQWLADAHPALAAQLVFMTGGAFTPRAREYLAAVANSTLEKPFDAANLKKVVGELIMANQTKASRRLES